MDEGKKRINKKAKLKRTKILHTKLNWITVSQFIQRRVGDSWACEGCPEGVLMLIAE